MKPLTEQQTVVMFLVCEGLSTKLIADRMGVAEGTAKFHLTQAMKRMKCSSRALAAVKFTLANRAEVAKRLEMAKLIEAFA